MVELISQVVNGLAIGNVYALLALGFSLVFGVSNLINFAQGSLFMTGAYLAWTAAAGWGLPLPVAALLAVAATTVLGLAIEWAALRPLAAGPPIAPLLSTIAVSVILDRLAELIWSPETQPFPSPLSGVVWPIGGAYLSAVDALIFAVGFGCMAALTLFLNRTWTGRAIRATAQDPEAALQMGVDVARMRRLSFGLAAALGGAGGVLVGMYYQSIFPAMGFPYGLKGFAAAMLGGIASVPGAIAGGLLLGVFESLASGYLGADYRNMVAYGLLLLVLLWRPQGLLGKRGIEGLFQTSSGLLAPPAAPGAWGATGRANGGARSAGGAERLGGRLRPSRRQALVALIALALLPVAFPHPYVLQVAASALVFAVLAMSLTLVSGTAGQISLGHAGLFGVGAYTTAILARNYGLPVELALPAAGLLAAVVGAVTAYPAIRLSGHAVAIATLAVGQLLYLLFLNWIPVTRGPMGIPGIPAPKLAVAGGLELWGVREQYWLGLAALGFAALLAGRLLRSHLGRTWRAIREDRVAARTSGIPVNRHLALAFASGGFLAAVAGGLYAHLLGFIGPDSFSTDTSILALTMAVLGGLGNLAGAAVGGVLLAVVPELFRGLADYRMVLYGLTLLLLVRFRPQGLAGID